VCGFVFVCVSCICVGVRVFLYLCVFAVEEPGTREAHLLEAVQEGVWFCICVCVLYLCGCACVFVFVCV